ncbi:MAG: DUF454 family protein [Gammaproteobacteria bacterium]|nr:DUF454 family protein [Gammaproteobacteria bacterium]
MYMDTETDRTSIAAHVGKAATLALAVILALIGLIGLVLPIIPGILFLGLAALVLTKISSRFAYYLDSQPQWQKMQRRWSSVRLLSITQRIKLMVLYATRSVLSVTRQLWRRWQLRNSEQLD